MLDIALKRHSVNGINKRYFQAERGRAGSWEQLWKEKSCGGERVIPAGSSPPFPRSQTNSSGRHAGISFSLTRREFRIKIKAALFV